MKLIHFPKTRFAELAARAGGITQSAAIEGALKGIESARPESDATILNAIGAIEEILYAPDVGSNLSEANMHAILRHADQIVTLAGMFCYEQLDLAARSLCDLVDGLLNSGQSFVAPIDVHVRALRLMAPGSTSPSRAEADKVFEGLQKILSHFKFISLSSVDKSLDVEP